MRTIDSRTAEEIGVKNLGLNPAQFDFSKEEALAALLRRCGAFKCPCPPAALVRSALALLNGVRDDQNARDLLSDLVDQLVSYGDFVESKEISGQSNARLLYIAPPAFVEVSPYIFLILGIGADDRSLLPRECGEKIERRGHARILKSLERMGARATLMAAGFAEITSEEWLKVPEQRTADKHLLRYVDLLAKSERPGSVDELQLLNTNLSVRYYSGRWEPQKRQTGTFVARRPQAYGAPLWSVVELEDGRLSRLLDLPTFETKWRGCDEAWHLQQAIDATAGHPQVYKLRDETDHSVVLDVFSPIPSWAQRRWDYVGVRVPRLHSLVAYRFDSSVLQAELHFAQERMWLSQVGREEA